VPMARLKHSPASQACSKAILEGRRQGTDRAKRGDGQYTRCPEVESELTFLQQTSGV
jgi:hypothetical protein